MEKLIAGLLLLLVLALPARAQDAFTTALPGLAGGFGEAAAAVEQLGASADPRALPVLRAMAEGRLQKTPEGRCASRRGWLRRPRDRAAGRCGGRRDGAAEQPGAPGVARGARAIADHLA
ncbi:hypothetical protein ACFQY5_01555 [Paeniroseomonas aquatica]|uniref:hypothetical protein n=1 Tax=Paeniroseomonas aquatica TaxID=373043 RepID=UPI0036245FB6